MGDATAIFSIHDQKDIEIHEVVQQVYDALKEKGYNPVNQLVGYILSEDPTYITTYKGARSLIRKVDRAAADAGTAGQHRGVNMSSVHPVPAERRQQRRHPGHHRLCGGR